MASNSELSIQGIRIREQAIGEGPPVLMAHGWGASIDALQPLALRLSQLGYQCLMFDLPGFGESGEPKQAFTIQDYATFCIDYLNHHELESVNYFGHSLGGRIGWKWREAMLQTWLASLKKACRGWTPMVTEVSNPSAWRAAL